MRTSKRAAARGKEGRRFYLEKRFERRHAEQALDLGPVAAVAGGETVILMIPLLFIPVETPAKGTGGCYQITVSLTASCRCTRTKSGQLSELMCAERVRERLQQICRIWERPARVQRSSLPMILRTRRGGGESGQRTGLWSWRHITHSTMAGCRQHLEEGVLVRAEQVGEAPVLHD